MPRRRVSKKASLQNRFGKTECARRPCIQGKHLHRQMERRPNNFRGVIGSTARLHRRSVRVGYRFRRNRPQIFAARNVRGRLFLSRRRMHRTCACFRRPRQFRAGHAEAQGAMIRKTEPSRDCEKCGQRLARSTEGDPAEHVFLIAHSRRFRHRFFVSARCCGKLCERSGRRPRESSVDAGDAATAAALALP